MSPLLELDAADGGSILVEVEEPGRGGPVTRGGSPADAVLKAGVTLEQALGQLGPAVRGIVSELRSAAEGPDQVEVAFSIRLTTGANIVIARAGGEANFSICLRWSRQSAS
jgi:Trypsin-co-occurring domain 1